MEVIEIDLRPFVMEVHTLGHFVHVYLRSKNGRIKIENESLSKSMSLYVQNNSGVNLKSEKYTNEVGGKMIRKKYTFSSSIQLIFPKIKSINKSIHEEISKISRESKIIKIMA